MNADMLEDFFVKTKIAQKSWVNSSSSKRRFVLSNFAKVYLGKYWG